MCVLSSASTTVEECPVRGTPHRRRQPDRRGWRVWVFVVPRLWLATAHFILVFLSLFSLSPLLALRMWSRPHGFG